MFVDSHCHLVFPELRERLPEIRAAMAQAQVSAALCISTRVEEIEQVVALAETDPQWWASAGVHPDTEGETEPDEALLLRWAAHPKVIAIGETGLDYYRLNGRSIADMAWQRERFRVHIRAGQATDLPLVIHTRQASEDTLALLREAASAGQPAPRGVFHCFTETMDVARAALDLGFLISFSGILTFRNAEDLRDVARYVPLDRCLIETDSPYLAPVPFRGKTNTPALVPHVAAELARQKQCSVEQVADATRVNFERLFGVSVAPVSNEDQGTPA
ncbi:MAG TPA: TatD family hydrolase [Ideonella sp.]|uniref:TatD family hydrolase n=1 Tax=Ideonella sp. TaxID=1929293 RepID=UPI002C2C9A66|nr:TatD family hydrolase [Ideonella sp.]HSI51219.1 TatD family hydrolase [Ideonella sp.]